MGCFSSGCGHMIIYQVGHMYITRHEMDLFRDLHKKPFLGITLKLSKWFFFFWFFDLFIPGGISQVIQQKMSFSEIKKISHWDHRNLRSGNPCLQMAPFSNSVIIAFDVCVCHWHTAVLFRTELFEHFMSLSAVLYVFRTDSSLELAKIA